MIIKRYNFECDLIAKTAGRVCLVLFATASLLVLPLEVYAYEITNNIEIRVKKDGFYSVSSAELSDILNISVVEVESMLSRISEIPLYCRDQKVATLISPSFDEVFFYGQAIDSIYTGENVYLLKMSGGDAIGTVPGSGPVPVGGGCFPEMIHYEQNKLALTGYFDDPDSDYWAWDIINTGDTNEQTKSFSFYVSSVASNADQARLNLQLFCGYSSGVTNEHHVVVDLNGERVGEKWWGGVGTNLMEIQFDQSLLDEGSNTLSVTGELDPGISYSIFYIDSFDLEYMREYKAVDDQLVLTGHTNNIVTVAGFSSSNICVADINSPKTPQLLEGITVDYTNGSHRVSFEPSSSNMPYCAFAADSARMVHSLAALPVNSLRAVTNDAEYLIITVPDLAVSAQALADYRSSLRIKTMVVYLEDIYHEFNDGIKEPQAIRDFLHYAYNYWAKKPRYVVLAGHGTYAYKDDIETLVPPVLVNTGAGMFASDGWYTDFDDDGLSDIAIGRLPALTEEELQHLVDRIISYEEVVSGNWLTNILFCADAHDDGGDFHGSSDRMTGLLPGGYAAEKAYLTDGALAETRTRLIDGINNGALFMNYFGHSGLDRLSFEGLLRTNDIASLTNSNMPTIVTAMSCVIGRFAVPVYDCLGEYLMLATNGGAVAVWSPSGIALNKSSELLSEDFYRTVLSGGENVLGDVIRKSMQGYSIKSTDKDILHFYNLLGDPALLVRGVRWPSDDPYAQYIPTFIEWKESYFYEAELLNVAISGDYADPDNDGSVTLAEYFFGRNPMLDDVVYDLFLPEQITIPENYEIMFAIRRSKLAVGVHAIVQISSDLQTWQDGTPYISRTIVTDDSNDKTETVKYFMKPPDEETHWFLRLIIEKQ